MDSHFRTRSTVVQKQQECFWPLHLSLKTSQNLNAFAYLFFFFLIKGRHIFMPADVVSRNDFRIVLTGFNYSQNHHGYTVLQQIRGGVFPHLLHVMQSMEMLQQKLWRGILSFRHMPDYSWVNKSAIHHLPFFWFNVLCGHWCSMTISVFLEDRILAL